MDLNNFLAENPVCGFNKHTQTQFLIEGKNIDFFSIISSFQLWITTPFFDFARMLEIVKNPGGKSWFVV